MSVFVAKNLIAVSEFEAIYPFKLHYRFENSAEVAIRKCDKPALPIHNKIERPLKVSNHPLGI
jgi:hypothetical protein